MADKRSAFKQGQIEILEVLYKYRFASRQLVADSLNIKAGSSLYERLSVLIKHELVAMRQEKRAKLLGIPAAYYLTPKGLKTLQALDNHDYINEAIIKASYRDKVVSQTFVSHTLDVYRYTNTLKHQYPDLKVYLRRDMSRFSYFPETPPDAFLSLKVGDSTPKRFFLDVVSDSLPRNILDRRISGYTEFFDDGGWEVTKSELPKLLLVTEKDVTARRARRTVRAALNRIDVDDEPEVYVTSFTMLESADTPSIWTSIQDSDEPLALVDM